MPTTYVPTRRVLNEAIKTFFNTNSGRPFELLRAPNKGSDVMVPADPPYGIIYPQEGTAFDGTPLFAPESDIGFHYQITSVGLRHDQAEWMSDKVRETFLGRNSSGAFLFSLSAQNLAIIDRQALGSPSRVEKSGMLYSTASSFVVYVSSQTS